MKEQHMDDLSLHESEHERPIVNFETRSIWFFHEFWPIVIFGTLFVMMVSLPIIMSGAFAELNKFSSADSVWPAYGLIIMGVFFLAVTLTLTIPRVMGWYLLLLGILALMVTEQGEAWAVGPSIAIIFCAYMIVGIAVLPHQYEKNSAGH